jgi:hypothetical protein
MSRLSDLIAYIDGVRQKMEGVVAEVDPGLVLCPGWTIKEAISHITAWEIVIQKAIQAYITGDPPYFLHEQDFDRFNQESVSERAAWTLAEVLQEWRAVRAELRETIKNLTEEILDEELVLPWGSERTMAELIEILGEHESEHLENIIKVAG